jgi:hypothetical protein
MFALPSVVLSCRCLPRHLEYTSAHADGDASASTDLVRSLPSHRPWRQHKPRPSSCCGTRLC